ncbi:MAG: hypothetical protein HY881_14600 [Deltaproteobacteria bacterium]|nr:hypothetical protein [Deltaproteobacteria bacterium]
MIPSVSPQRTSLRVAANDMFLPVVMAYVEQSSLALGLGKSEALKMTLASEELFLHLCRVVIPNQDDIRIRCVRKGHFVQSDFSFPETGFNMQAFNLTATPRSLENADFDDMRLILASRSVDRLKIRRKENHLQISLIKEKKYPRATEPAEPLSPFNCNNFAIRYPSADELKFLAPLTRTFYPELALPPFFQYPGMLVDMMQSGEYHAVIAAGPAGEIGGGMLWHLLGDRTVEAIGPYVFGVSGADRIAGSLIEACISEAGRTSAIAMICHPPATGQYHEYFEFLGDMDQCSAGCARIRQSSWFRMMREDMGSVVWTPADLEAYLRQTYSRLFLPREIRMVTDDGENQSDHSVLSTQMDRPGSRVDLDILWPGADFEDNLLRHLQLFRNEGIRNVVFGIDVGSAWKSAIIPCLLRNGFQPVLILPCAGDGDIVLFQLFPCAP